MKRIAWTLTVWGSGIRVMGGKARAGKGTSLKFTTGPGPRTSDLESAASVWTAGRIHRLGCTPARLESRCARFSRNCAARSRP